MEVEKEESGIYNGFLFGLNDPYAVYYTPEELASFMDETNGSYWRYRSDGFTGQEDRRLHDYPCI